MVVREISEEKIDVLSKYAVGEMQRIYDDPTIDGAVKNVVTQKLRTLSTTFCGTCLMLSNTYLSDQKLYISHTVGVFEEPGYDDGVYVYMSFNNIADNDLPPNMRYENTYTFFASTDPDNMFIDIFFGEALICKINIGTRLPEVSTPDDLDDSLKDVSNRVRSCAITAISMVSAALAEAYLNGLNYGKSLREKENDEE